MQRVDGYSFLCIEVCNSFAMSVLPHTYLKSERQPATITHQVQAKDQLCECQFLLRKSIPLNLLNKSRACSYSYSFLSKPRVTSKVYWATAEREELPKPSILILTDFTPVCATNKTNEFAPHFHVYK